MLAGASKLVANSTHEAPPAGMVWALIFRWSQSPTFAILEFSIGIVFCLIPWAYVRVFFAMCITVMVTLGIVVRRKRNNAACMCFGSLTPKNPRTLFVLELFLLVGAAIVAVLGTISPRPAAVPTWVAWSLAALTSVGVGFLIRSGKVKNTDVPTQRPKTSAPSTPSSELQNELVLGKDQEGKSISFGEVVPQRGPLFIVGVHSACKMCKSLIPDLIGFAKGFGEQFPIVLIANEAGYAVTDSTARIQVLVDEAEVLARALQLDSRPFALLINGETGKIMAAPSLGNDGVRRLFAVMLNARQPAILD